MARGRLITIEGIDGAGKSTLAAALAAALREQGADVLALREPGGVPLAERVRALVMDPAQRVDPRAEALLYAAARAQLVAEQLEPALAAGRWVLLDRFVDSSLAYQGAGRELGLPEIAALNAFATGGLRADRTLLLVIDPATGRARRGERTPDRLEASDDAFFARVDAGYRALAQAEPQRVRVLDASVSPDVLLAAALGQLADL
ncbi:MAG: dTMP kinase [Solirubrobacteraceae bacterium]|jgi:dTMP kinase